MTHAYYLFASPSTRLCHTDSPSDPSGELLEDGGVGPWTAAVLTYRQFADALNYDRCDGILISHRAKVALERASLTFAADVVPVEVTDLCGHVIATYFAFVARAGGDDRFDLYRDGNQWRASHRFLECVLDNNLGGFCFSKSIEYYEPEDVVVDTCALNTPFWDALRLSDRLDRHIEMRNEAKLHPPDYTAWLDGLRQRFKAVEQALQPLCALEPSGRESVEPELTIICEPPATLEQLELMEAELSRRLPWWLRDWFLRFSRRVDVTWSLPTQAIERLPIVFQEVVKQCPLVEFDLDGLETDTSDASDTSTDLRSEEECLGIDDRMHWSQVAYRDMIILSTAFDGAQLAAVVSGPYEGAIVKVDLDSYRFQCTILADSIMEFFDTWLALFCIDFRVDCITPFFDFAEQRLRADTDVAAAWRKAVLEFGK